MKSCMAISFALFVIGISGCASESTAVREGRFETPEVDLPLQTADVQRLVDDAPDGGTVNIPMGRYVLSGPLTIRRRRNQRVAFTPGAQLRCANTDEAVIAIEDCQGLTLSGVRARHVKPLASYNCHGPVVSVSNSRDVRIENCELNGCGAIGVSARRSTLSITNCHVHHNTFNAFYFESCDEVSVIGNVIEYNANTFQAYRCGEILWSDNLVRDNGGYWETPHRPGLQTGGKPTSQPSGDK
jgi:hypothetical protein